MEEIKDGRKNSVRIAVPADISAISKLQAQKMREKLVAELEAPLSLETAALLKADDFAQVWAASWQNFQHANPLLVAVSKTEENATERIVGFLSAEVVTPAEFPQAPTGERQSYLISNLLVNSADLADGHEGRLLAAITDILATQAATELYIWAFATDEWSTTFLNKAGFAPAGIRRYFQIDSKKVAQHLWWTML